MKAKSMLLLVLTALLMLNFSKAQEQPQKMYGAYAENKTSSFFELEKRVEKKLEIMAVFSAWGDDLPDLSGFPEEENQKLLIFWESYGMGLKQIAEGEYDIYIKKLSDWARQYKGQIILAPFHEMNGNWNDWNGMRGKNTPADFILAWRHVKEVFGYAENVKWAWVVNNISVPDVPENEIANYYPGDGYVDYTGVDGFNFGSPWQSYDEIFSESLSELKKYKKPVFIFSMASAQGEQKAEWIRDAFLKIKSDKSIEGAVWFNENKEKNWLVWSDENSLQAFKEAIK